MADSIDVRQLVLSGGVKAKRQPLYVERLGGWFNIQELYGDERARVLQDAVEQKTGRVNLGVLYAGILVQTLRYPASDVAPSAPVAPDPLQGTSTETEQEAYDKALAKYQADSIAFQEPYPTDHPHAGEKVFDPKDRDAMNASLPGEVISLIVEPSFVLSGFKKDDVAEKKDFFAQKPAGASSTTTSSPSDSSEATSSDSSLNSQPTS